MHVVDPTQHLIHKYLGIDVVKRMKTHELKEVLMIRLHGDIKVLIFDLVSDEGGIYFDDEWIIEHFYYFQFSCLVLLVLLDSLQCYHLPCTLYPGTEYFPECARTYQLFNLNLVLLEFLRVGLYL